MKWRSTLLVCTFYAFFSAGLHGKELPVLASVETIIVNKYGLQNVAVADLGDLPIGEEGVINITLYNPTEKLFDIQEIKAGCACLSPQIKDAQIKPGDSTEFAFVLRTPQSSTKPLVTMSTRLILSDQSTINLAMQYRLQGLLVFQNPMIVVQLDHAYSSSEFKLPLVLTPPIKASELLIEPSDSLRNVVFRLEGSEEQTALVGLVEDSESVSSTGLAGRVAVRSEEPPTEAMVDLIIRRAQPVTASPSVLRFVPDEAGKTYSAKVLVRVNSSIPVEEKGNAMIDCIIDGRVPTATPKHLGNDVYSVDVKMSDEFVGFITENPDQKCRIRITAKTKQGTWSVENAVLIAR